MSKDTKAELKRLELVAGQIWRERKTGRVISVIDADSVWAGGGRVRYKDLGSGRRNSLLIHALHERFDRVIDAPVEAVKDLTREKRAQQYAALNDEYRAQRDALDVDYDQAIDRHGADPVLLVAYMDGFDALDADFLARREALDIREDSVVE